MIGLPPKILGLTVIRSSSWSSYIGETPRFCSPLSREFWRLRAFYPNGFSPPDFRPEYLPSPAPTIAFLDTDRVRSFSCVSRLSWFLLPVSFIPFVVPPSSQPVPAKRESPFLQPPLPSLPRADGRGLNEQSVLLLLLRQPGELGMERVVGWQ